MDDNNMTIEQLALIRIVVFLIYFKVVPGLVVETLDALGFFNGKQQRRKGEY